MKLPEDVAQAFKNADTDFKRAQSQAKVRMWMAVGLWIVIYFGAPDQAKWWAALVGILILWQILMYTIQVEKRMDKLEVILLAILFNDHKTG
jgi:hypothetical protein